MKISIQSGFIIGLIAVCPVLCLRSILNCKGSMDSGAAQDVLGCRRKAAPRVEKMGFSAMRAGNGQVAKPAAEPGGGGGGFQHGAGINRLIERVDEVPELMPIDHLSSEMWVENRDTTSGLVSHRHQESARHLDAEDVEANPFGGAAVCERARNRQARHPVEHEVEVHGIWMHRNIFMAANSHVFEDNLV